MTVQKQILVLVVLSLNSLFSFSQIELPDSIRSILTNHPKVNYIKYDSIFYKSGQLLSEGWLYDCNYWGIEHDERYEGTISVRVGTWRCYDKKGRINQILLFPIFDSLITVEQYFDNSGFKKAEHRYKRNEHHPGPTENSNYRGSWNPRANNYNRITYYKNGNVKFDFNFCGLKLCGDYKFYYPNGQLSYSFHLNSNGKEDGPYNYFDKQGILLETGQYRDGKKYGVWKTFDKEGNLKKEKNYSN
jgi:hypothetical protein